MITLSKISYSVAWFLYPLFYLIQLSVRGFQALFGYYLLISITNKKAGCRIRGYGRFIKSDNISLGKAVHIGEGAHFVSHGGISIGRNTIISRNCTIRSRDHAYDGDLIPFSKSYNDSPVVVGKGVWIGMNVTVNPGVNIGDFCILASNAVVTRDVPEGEVWGGVPAKKIASRDILKLRTLAAENKWLVNL